MPRHGQRTGDTVNTARILSALILCVTSLSVKAQNAKELNVVVTNTPLPVVQQGAVAAQQSGAWNVAVAQPQAKLFQVGVLITAAANYMMGQLQLTFPRAALVEQLSSTCQTSTPKTVRVSTSGGVASGFTSSPTDGGNMVTGMAGSAALATTPMPNGFSGSFVSPTPVRLLVSSDNPVTIELFRDLSGASSSEYCYVFLAGRWTD